MRLQLIRNAALILDYAGHTILIDPDLADKHTRPSFTGRSKNPTVDLPFPASEITSSLNLVIVSHLHKDHFDAVGTIDVETPILCQPSDEQQIAAHGFASVTPVTDSFTWDNLQIRRTGGQHGTGVVGQLMGKVSGFVLSAPEEPTVYWAGDTILYDEILQTIAQVQPDIIVTHSCGASWPDPSGERQLIVMDASQTIAVCQAAPQSIVVATHMEAVDHATVTRSELRQAADAAGISHEQLIIPEDGEALLFEQ